MAYYITIGASLGRFGPLVVSLLSVVSLSPSTNAALLLPGHQIWWLGSGS